MKRLLLFAMKRYPVFLLLLNILFLVACAGDYNADDARAEVYKNATEKVCVATSSAELVEISYKLKKQLSFLDRVLVSMADVQRKAAAGDEECQLLLDNICSCRSAYEKKLVEREMQFYSDR